MDFSYFLILRYLVSTLAIIYCQVHTEHHCWHGNITYGLRIVGQINERAVTSWPKML